MASQILGMPAGDAGSGAGDPPWRCGSEGEKGTRPLPASGVRRGRIRVPAPVRIAPGSGLTAVAGVPCELRLDGFGVGRIRDAFGEGEGPCNLSKSCFLGGFFSGIRSGAALAPAGSTRVSGEMPASRVGERELLQSQRFYTT